MDNPFSCKIFKCFYLKKMSTLTNVFFCFFVPTVKFLKAEKLVIFKTSVMISVLSSSAEGRGFDSWLGQTKDIKIGICCFSTKHTDLRSRSNDLSAQSQNNVLGYSGLSSCRLAFVHLHVKNSAQRVGLVQNKVHHHHSS